MKEVDFSREVTLANGKAIVLAKKGNDYVVIRLNEIAFFFTKERLVFAIDKDGKKYIITKTIAQLEQGLDPNVFFRINRQCIINMYFIKRFRTYQRSRIEIELHLPEPVFLLISQSATISFRRWINQD